MIGWRRTNKSSSELYGVGGFLGQEVDDEDDDEDEDEDTLSSSSITTYKQTMSQSERKENLAVMRQIFKYDLNDLQARADYAGWVQARKDLKRRQARDPWFALNNQLKEAILQDLGDDLIEELERKIQEVGGPPPPITHKRKYATVAEIYDTDMSLGKAEAIVQLEQQRINSAKWAKLLAEREANERRQAEENANTNPYLKAEEEARKRREKTMRILYSKVEEERKKKAAKAKEIQEKYGIDKEAFLGGGSLLDKAIESAKKQLEETKLKKAGGLYSSDTPASSSPASSTTDDESAEKSAAAASGKGRIPGDKDMTRGEIEVDLMDFSDTTTNNVRVQVSTSYNAAQSDPPMRKHSFVYTIRITNVSPTDSIQLLSRKFEIQTVGARQKDVVKGEGVTGRQPILRPGEAFEYTSSAPLSVRPLGTTIAAARMSGEYQFNIVEITGKDADGNPTVKVLSDSPLSCQLGMFHFIFPEDQRVKPVRSAAAEEDEDDDEDDEDASTTTSKATASGVSSKSTSSSTSSTVASTPSLPGDEDMKTGKLLGSVNDSSETTTDGVKVKVTSQYREERSDPKTDKHCFAYNIRITNENTYAIQLTGRKFEIQTVGSSHKDVVAGPGVTGRQPVLQPGESFEYTSTAPLSVHPLPTTPVVARMQGEYTFTKVGDSSSQPTRQAKLGVFHFILPALDIA